MRFLPLLLLFIIVGISLGFSEDRIIFPKNTDFLPEHWREEPISAAIVPLSDPSREIVTQILTRAFSKYPPEILQQNLSKVAVVESLKFYGVAYGGTYIIAAQQIVLVYRPLFTAQGFEQRFHHEFSSILLQKNKPEFDLNHWSSANSPGTAYRVDGVIEEPVQEQSESTKVLAEAQKKTGGSGAELLNLDPDLMKLGYLTQYNQVSVEQDVNEVAAHLFTNPEIWDFCRRYPRIDQKVHVLIDFYQKIDPGMDRIFFRKLTLNPTASPEP